jgi:D-alanyl-D-alanine carboxypeptidase
MRPQTAHARAEDGGRGPRLAFAPSGYDFANARPTSQPAARDTAGLVPPPVAVSRGAPPSTLQQQAALLERGGNVPPSPPYAVRGPRPSDQSGGFEIQIGAYATSAEAERALAHARGAAGELLRTSEARSIPVAKENRRVFRARFVGFDSSKAASTCLELRRRQIDCFVMRGE